MSNHRSNFDPLVTWVLLPKEGLVFISKPSNFHLPWFGRFIHRLRFFAIDRSSIAASRRVFADAAAMITSGEASIAVYPEGTRSKSREMLPFHNAVFITAIRAKAPVVVCTIDGTELVSKRWPRKTRVTLKCLEVIPNDWIAEHTMQELSERVEIAMRNNLGLPKT